MIWFLKTFIETFPVLSLQAHVFTSDRYRPVSLSNLNAYTAKHAQATNRAETLGVIPTPNPAPS